MPEELDKINDDEKSDTALTDVNDAPLKDDFKPEQTEYGLVQKRNIESEMKNSYLDYAMSVIVARALPDVRDGLKPVHRRVLFSMNELGLTSKAKYRKSATVVGDVLGKYHPHGDIAVYDSLVRMAQNFAMRYPLVDGQGNFGSIDGDNPAAMRYTEAKMKALSEEMLADIDKNTVNFSPNFDGSRLEPNVLPAKVPQLLLNGTLGIAVGMATNIPPHNLNEIIDGTIKVIDNPDISIDELMESIPGPDFPTGGEIFNPENVKMAYTTGKGPVLMRAVANIEEKKNGGFRIIVSEIPYQVNKAELISKIADLVKQKKIEGISDLRDESDRKEGVRIVIELKNNAYSKKILNQLYELTVMQSVFHVNMLALIDGLQPKILTLKNVLEEFIKHRRKVVRRRTEFDLSKAKDREHILEGLKKALDHIDEIIKIIKKSETKEVAHKNLIVNFKFSDKQSSAILEMKLSALAGLERKKIEDELEEKRKLIALLEKILASESEILKIIKNELSDIKEKYSDARRTKINKKNIGNFSDEDLIPNEQVIVSLTKSNYIKRVPVSTYRAQQRGGKGVAGMATKEEDSVDHLLVTSTLDDIMFFTDKGRVFNCKVYDIPSASRQAKGQAIVNILQISPEEKVTAVISLNVKNNNLNKYFFMGTEKGVVKKTEIDAYKNVRKTGIIAIKLNQGDELKWVSTTTGSDNIIMVTRNGQSINFYEKDVRSMGRSAAGVRGIKLKNDDEVIAMDISTNIESFVFTILENGFGKKTKIKNFNLQKRGGIGIRASKTSNKTGKVVEALVDSSEEGDIVIISKQGQVIRTSIKSVKQLGRDTQGVTMMRLNAGDKVSSMTILKKEKFEVEKIENANKNNNENASSGKTEKKDIIDGDKKNITDSKKKASNDPKHAKIVNSKEESVESNNTSNQANLHINKIEPKKIVTQKQDFNPIVKAQQKKTSVKEFKPFIRSQNIKEQGLPNIKKSNLDIKHYQSNININADQNKSDDKKEQSDDQVNYWDGNLWNKK